MANTLIPLTEYLLPLALGIRGNFDPKTPRLGVKGVATLGKPPGQTDFAILRSLSPEEFTRYNEASDELAKYRAARQVIQIAILNAAEFEESLAGIEKSYVSETAVTREWMNDLVVRLNQRILNFLSAMRTYLDHAETRLKRKFGKTSSQVDRFKKATAAEFDGHFAYRFMYKLRNYTQHCGMPLGYISGLSSLPTPRPDEAAKHSIDFFFGREELLRNFDDWGPKVTTELQALPDRFPLRAYVEQMAHSLRRVDVVLAQIDREALDVPLKYLAQLQAEIGPTAGTPCVYTHLDFIPGPEQWQTNFDYTAFPVDVMADLAVHTS